MLLAIDIGNSHITVGVYEDKLLRFVARLLSDARRTEDQYAIELCDVLNLYGVKRLSIDGSIISSVVPELTPVLFDAVRKSLATKPLILGPGLKTGVNIGLDNAAQLGADLVAGAVAAISMFPMPCVIFDLGTATTISVLDENGKFLGGSICAGVGITLEAMYQKTALLPHISIEKPERVIGKNTVHSMQSGLVYGTAAMMDGMAERFEKELGREATLVATGGLAGQIVPACRRKIICCDNLLLEGLRILYEKNTPAK